MKMNKTIRIYGKVAKTWKQTVVINGWEHEVTTQMEIKYKEYYLDGKLKSVGTEDFSPERYKNELVNCQVCTWDGKRRNKGGHRWFDLEGSMTILKRQRKDVKKYLENKYKESEIVELRTI